MAETIPKLEELVNEAKKAYLKEFGSEPKSVVFAPGRVNLIGEHTDYNDGFVMPMALPLVTVIAGSKVEGDVSTVVTLNPAMSTRKATFEMPKKEALVKTIPTGDPKWANYVKGVVANYIGNIPPAFNCVINSSVPTGGGLSSSASLEVATYVFLDQITGSGSQISLTDKALACQKAEHDYAGMPCGIMDQFISFMGKKGNALLIDCRSLKSTLIPLDDPNIVVLIVNSNVKHELTGSEYSTRRRQCEEAAQLLKKVSVRDATIQDIDYLKSLGTDEEIVKRARHAITEIARTAEAAEALKAKDYIKFGHLMVDSHKSLRDDYDVSIPEIDQLVELALEVDGVLGSRITGGGFGGCTVTLVYKNVVDQVIQNILSKYKGTPTFYICQPSPGADKVCSCNMN